MSHWALDLGTTNTSLAHYDEASDRALLVELPGISREPHSELSSGALVPSATDVQPPTQIISRLVGGSLLGRVTLWGRQGHIGTEALDRNLGHVRPTFVAGIKPHLQHQANRPVARLGRRAVTAREVLALYLRELLAAAKRATGHRIRQLTVTAPVDAYEGYRAEIREQLRRLGVRSTRFVDEPVAAAAGYGCAVAEPRTIAVVDMGGGTLDVAVVEVDASAADRGKATVLAKEGQPVGGDLVDRWLLEHIFDAWGAKVPHDPFWRRLLLDEARRVKEALHLHEREPFVVPPPPEAAVRPGFLGRQSEVELHRDALHDLLETRGLHQTLTHTLDRVLEAATAAGLPEDGLDDVLLVGGSTLLPGVFALLEARFGRHRVRGWQPFEAVVTGACLLSARGFAPADHIVHDYAIVVFDEAGSRRTTTVVEAGTPFPTADDHWRRQLVPSCALHEPQRTFELVVCEIGRAPPHQRSFGWDATGQLRRLDDGSLVVPLNDANPALGFLEPPHHPSDRSARLDVRLGIDADRWLVATVLDLRTQRLLMRRQPLVRLL
ncbi:MAG: Hsp70 family protein [Myxococcales bacterium]|nr:Hsp70 family protein [Myxococcales bacterium]